MKTRKTISPGNCDNNHNPVVYCGEGVVMFHFIILSLFMPISHLIAKYDLSRYTVYQMLEYVSATQDRKVVQEERDGMYLIKTTVSVNDLYNYAHILDGKLSTDDNSAMKTFFADDIFRIKFPENESLSQACA